MKWTVILSIILVGLCQADFPSDIPDLDDLEVVKTRCDKKGGAGTYDKIKKAEQETQTCIKGIVDIDTVKTEVEEAKKTGSMDEVFGKYCGKRPQIKECLKKVNDAVQPCLEESEKQALNVTTNILEQIADFACFRDGDRIAMFVAEGGVKCLEARVENIKDCVNQTLKFNPATFSPNSIPNLTIDKKKCDDLTSIQDCVVKDLEDHCADSTPANIIDALFRFVKKTACKDVKPKRSISLKREIRSTMAATQALFTADLEEKFKATCTQNGGEDAFDKLMAAYNASKPCLKKYRMFVTPYNIYRISLANCTVDTRKAMENCLKEDEKYYPDFVLELLQSVFRFMYSNVDKMMVARQSNMEFANCMRALNQEESQKELIKCFKEHANDTNDAIIKVPPKPELCMKIKEQHDTCFSNTVKNKCVKDITITKFVEDLSKAVEAPCQNKTADNEP